MLYWENSIGRSRSCDIYLPDPSASRDHAVLLRRDEGWFICDTGSKSGVLVNGKKIEDRKLVSVGDTHHHGLHHADHVERRPEALGAPPVLHRLLPGGGLPHAS